jgi:hypothetical protein
VHLEGKPRDGRVTQEILVKVVEISLQI